MGDGVANNLNDASHLPHLAESFLVLHSTSCNLAEGPSRVIALLHRRSSGHRLDQGYGSTCMYDLILHYAKLSLQDISNDTILEVQGPWHIQSLSIA